MTISNALDSAGRILIGYWSKVLRLKWIRDSATGTTLEIFHEAGKHPDVMELLNICVITGRMDDGRKNDFNNSQRHFIQTNSI
jgi:hypothetical protein